MSSRLDKNYSTNWSDMNNWSDTYLTDPRIIEITGPYELDPCCPKSMPWKTAKYWFAEGIEDGLILPWSGRRVWLNPPYRRVLPWIKKFVENGSGICLLNGRSLETKATQLAMSHASAVFFPQGRLNFYNSHGEVFPQKYFGSVLIGLKEEDKEALIRLKEILPGTLLSG